MSSSVPVLLVVDSTTEFVAAARYTLEAIDRHALAWGEHTQAGAIERVAELVQQGTAPTIVVADAMLPDGSGAQLLAVLKTQLPGALLVLTSNASRTELRLPILQASLAGALHLFVPKQQLLEGFGNLLEASQQIALRRNAGLSENNTLRTARLWTDPMQSGFRYRPFTPLP